MKRTFPTLSNIQKELKAAIGYDDCMGHLCGLLHELDFAYRRCKSCRQVLMERKDVVMARISYLKTIRKAREEGERIIVLHCGNKNGFLNGYELMFKAKSKTGDYHDEMNKENFTKRLETQSIPNAPAASVLVIDNVPYHSVQEDRLPTMAKTIAHIQQWQQRKGVQYSNDLQKRQVIDLCKTHQPAKPIFSVDQILTRHGHSVIRLPQYHPDLNPIELIWATLKGYIARRNLSFKMTDVERLIQEGLQSISRATSANCCRHVTDIEARLWRENIAPSEKAQTPVLIALIGTDTEATDAADESTDTAPGTVTDTAPETETDTADEI
ncbi:uncharacterized protein LOC123526970 [Mercenaria mercenaria]|uniref:uncharacterized protein LOC123526970 n=1 Tax=Mercenaria mercenaria TaxID=6596 RepID=UPI00234E378B|nr:uncharacterized protein LOC123526970 [Mercenaria mercenaria]